MSSSAIQSIKYITDQKGKWHEVIIPLKKWSSLTEELEMLQEKQKILLGLQRACKEAKLQEKGKIPE